MLFCYWDFHALIFDTSRIIHDTCQCQINSVWFAISTWKWIYAWKTPEKRLQISNSRSFRGKVNKDLNISIHRRCSNFWSISPLHVRFHVDMLTFRLIKYSSFRNRNRRICRCEEFSVAAEIMQFDDPRLFPLGVLDRCEHR